MNRYFFYNFLLVGLMNLMLFVPHILIENRFNGAVASLVVAPVIGGTLIYMYTGALKRYPGKGLPEIMQLHMPRWVSSTFMAFMAIMWWFASTIVVVAFAMLINRFFNPDANATVILIALALGAAYAATRTTLTIMLIMEVGIIVNTPIILFVLFKIGRDPKLSWDAIHVVANYAAKMPTIATLAAATFIFTGYINLSLFNRLFPANFRFKHLWVYPLLGFIILLITFFIPIGIHGSIGVDRYIYLWTISADSLMMQYGFIERLMFLFLIVFLNLSLVYTAAGWHQAMEFIKCCLPSSKPDIDNPQAPAINYVIVGLFVAASVAYMLLTDEKLNLIITTYWLIIRMLTEFGIVLLVFVLSRRRLKSP